MCNFNLPQYDVGEQNPERKEMKSEGADLKCGRELFALFSLSTFFRIFPNFLDSKAFSDKSKRVDLRSGVWERIIVGWRQ